MLITGVLVVAGTDPLASFCCVPNVRVGASLLQYNECAGAVRSPSCGNHKSLGCNRRHRKALMLVWDFFGKNGEVPQQQDGREGLAPMDSSSQADVMNKMQAISQLKAELDAIYPTLQSASQTHIRPHESVNLPIGHTTVNASVVQEEHETRRGSDGQSFAPQPARPPPAWYQDIKAREEWTTSIAKRVSKSPDSQADGLQLLEAQLVRAERAAKLACEVANSKAKEAAAAAEAAERAQNFATNLANELRQRREDMLNDLGRENERDCTRVSEISQDSRSSTIKRGNEQTEQKKRTDGRMPKLVVVELEGGIFQSFDPEPVPPFSFKADAWANNLPSSGALLDAQDETAAVLCPGALDALRTFLSEAAKHDSKVAVLSRLHTPETADHLLAAIDLGSLGVARDAVNYVIMCPSLGKTHSISETLRATMAKSSMESLRRRTRVDFNQMLYMGAESRACRDLSALGITCKRLPYGLSHESWLEALELFRETAS